MKTGTNIYSLMRPLVLFLLCIQAFTATIPLSGQCGPQIEWPDLDCSNAPLICLQNWCSVSPTFSQAGPIGFCGPNTVVSNPQYYAFIAEDEDVEIQILVGNCNGGSSDGLQSALLQNCPWSNFDVIDCNPETHPGGIMTLQSYGFLVPGQVYWILIDGFTGGVCEYTFIQTTNIYEFELSDESTTIIASPPVVEPGYSGLHFEVSPAVDNAHGYYWVLGWSGDTIITSLPSLDMNVPCDMMAGTYSVCVRAFSGCDTSDMDICTEVEFLPLEDVIKPSSIFCAAQFPFIWEDLVIPGPGIYTQPFESPTWCFYDSIWQVDAYPESEIAVIDTNICGYEFNYEGEFIDANGTYIFEYPGQSQYGCDSTLEINLTFHYPLEFFVEAVCEDSQHLLRPIVTLHYLPNDSIRYAWYDCNFTEQLSTSETFNPDTSGCYCLVADHSFCSDTICSTYVSDPCQSDCSLVRDTACAGESVLFFYNGTFSPDAQYHWLIERPGTEGLYYSEQRFFSLTYTEGGWYDASLTVIDSSSTTSCSDSFYINGYTSEASICCNGPECGSCTDLTINLSGASPWTVYLYNTFQNDTIYGVTDSTLLYTVCPPADSVSIYSLVVTDSINQCHAKITSNQPVFVQMRPEPEAIISQTEDTLCGAYVENTSYRWLTCDTYEFLSSAICYQPSASGCYCLKVTTGPGCTDTICYDFVLSTVSEAKESGVAIYPNPSNGQWEVTLPYLIALPVEWALFDVYNRRIENGWIWDANPTIQLTAKPAAGLYYLHFMSASKQSFSTKVVIQ